MANLRINFFGLLFISLNIYTETVEIEEPTKDTAMSMEESLLPPEKRSELEGRERLVLTRDVFTQEAKKLAYIATHGGYHYFPLLVTGYIKYDGGWVIWES